MKIRPLLRAIVLSLALITALGGFAQNYQPVTLYGQTFNRGEFNEVLGVPYGPGFRLNTTLLRPGRLFFNTSDSTLYTWTGFQWRASGGSGGGDTAAAAYVTTFNGRSLAVTAAAGDYSVDMITGAIDSARLAQALLPYLLPKDTVNLSARIDSIKQRSDRHIKNIFVTGALFKTGYVTYNDGATEKMFSFQDLIGDSAIDFGAGYIDTAWRAADELVLSKGGATWAIPLPTGADSGIFATRYWSAQNFYPLTGNPSGFLTQITAGALYPTIGRFLDSIASVRNSIGTSGATTFDELTDVTITEAKNNNVPRYDSVSGQWVNTPSAFINMSGIVNGNTIIWDAAAEAFVPAPPATGGTTYTLPPATTSTLGGVIVGNTLKVDGTSLLNIKQNHALYTNSYNSVMTWDCDLSTNHIITLSGNITSMNFANLEDGEAMYIIFRQDATGGRTVSGWPPSTKFIGGALALSAAANAEDMIGIKNMGGTLYITYGNDYK